jgi:hypothetical protein
MSENFYVKVVTIPALLPVLSGDEEWAVGIADAELTPAEQEEMERIGTANQEEIDNHRLCRALGASADLRFREL